jgi:limonene-1,2-epoxide hydrolase
MPRPRPRSLRPASLTHDDVAALGAAEQPTTPPNPPEVATAWQDAWNGTDPARLGALFTTDGSYIDHAIGTTMQGRDQVSAWKEGTNQLISDVRVSVSEAFRHGDRVAIQSVYAGHIDGAPTPFAVPMCTILDLSQDKISKNQDYYSLAAVVAQSGLPADWTPGTTQPQS